MSMTIREEQYLAKIAGETDWAPEPKTREEELLNKIAKNGGGGGLPSVTSADEGKVLSVVEDTQTQTFIPLQHIAFDKLVALEGVTMDASSFSEGDECVITIGENQYTAVWTVYEDNSSFFWEGSGDDSIMIGYDGDWRVYVYIEGEEAGDISAVAKVATGSYSWAAENGVAVRDIVAETTGGATVYKIANGNQLVKDLEAGKPAVIKYTVATPPTGTNTVWYRIIAYSTGFRGDQLTLNGADISQSTTSIETYNFQLDAESDTFVYTPGA